MKLSEAIAEYKQFTPTPLSFSGEPIYSLAERIINKQAELLEKAKQPKHTREEIKEILVQKLDRFIAQKIAEASSDLVIDALIEAGILTVNEDL